MKYSILMPYYKRDNFQNTLVSFRCHYSGRDDYEIILVVDKKNNEEDLYKLNKIVSSFEDIKIKVILSEKNNKLNPAPLYNEAAKNSSGEFFIITNPECMHLNNILGELDNIFNTNKMLYVICASQNVGTYNIVSDIKEFRYKFLEWYQHSQYNNRCLHFCTALHKELFYKIDGFDEHYQNGLGWDDNDFITKIQHTQIPIIIRDDLITLHLHHDRVYQENRVYLFEINRQYYIKKWNLPETTQAEKLVFNREGR